MIPARLPRPEVRGLKAWFAALALCLLATTAQANDLSDFEAARDIYAAGDYPAAVKAFSDLVGGDPPRLSDVLLVLESRKYLAASLVFVKRPDAAREQFKKLLRQEEDYALDPLAFPRAVVALFQSVRAQIQAEVEARKAAQAESKARRRREAREAQQRRRQSVRTLREMARQRRTETLRLRWIAMLPFGVGQFQNDHKELGYAFATVEALFGIASIGTFFAHQSLTSDTPRPDQVADGNRFERTFRLSNWVSFGAFVAVALAGIIDAQVRFKGVTIRDEPRPLPKEVDHWVDEQLRAGAPFRWVW